MNDSQASQLTLYQLIGQSALLAQTAIGHTPELLSRLLVWDLENLTERAQAVLALEDGRLDQPALHEDHLRLAIYSHELAVSIEDGDQGRAIQAGANLADLLRLLLLPWKEPASASPQVEEDELFHGFDEGNFTDFFLKDEE